MLLYLKLISFLLAGGFLITYKINKISLIPSYLLSLSFVSIVTTLSIYLYPLAFEQNSIVARISLLFIFLPFVLISVFGIYVLIIILLINARTILKRESKSLAHALTLILAICLIGYLIATHLIEHLMIPEYVEFFISAIYVLFAFYFIHIIHYMITTIICNLSRPKLNQHSIIVHGSGLINGEVPPLLAGRIDKAIAFYHKQKKVHEVPKLIFSGGQGSDESRPEAIAMAKYAYKKGIPKQDTILEDQSTTTLENMRFSKEIMDKHSKGEAYRCIYTTSNYHLFRTGLYAKSVGLKMSGIGSKTTLYYLPNALIREYIAYIVMYKKRHIIFISFVFLCALILSVASIVIDLTLA